MYRTSHITQLTVLILAGLLTLSGCQTSKNALSKLGNIETPALVYKQEIVQGNFVSAEQVAALRPGMPRAQVKNILGTPLLTDVFHPDRWDYVFTITRDGKPGKTNRLTVYFQDDLLTRHDGDAMPSENDFIKTLSSGRKIEKPLPLTASDKELADFAKRENPISKSQSTGSPNAPDNNLSKTYPPLESK